MNPDTSRAPAGRTTTVTGLRGTTRLEDTQRGHSRMDARRRQARRWWRRCKRSFRRVWRRATETITPTGVFSLACAVVAAVLAVTLDWPEAWFVCAVSATALLAGLPFLLGGRSYLMELSVPRTHIVAGGRLEYVVEIENASARPALPAIAELPVGEALRELPVPMIAGHGHTRLVQEAAAAHRGVIEVGPVTLARRDPLGLVRREITWRDRVQVHVHPKTVLLPPTSAGLVRDLEGSASAQLTDADLSFHAVREYLPGDALRHVHWKSTAKTGTLMVRQYEETQSARVALLCDVVPSAYSDRDEFELGVSVAASLAVQAVREGRERFIASQWTPGTGRPSLSGIEELPASTSTAVLNALAALEATPEGDPIPELTRRLAASQRQLSTVFIVTGAVTDLTELRRALAAFPDGVRLCIVRCAALAEPAVNRFDRATLLTVGVLSDLPRLLFGAAA